MRRRVLFISDASGPDYQCDMLFHGLRSSTSVEVTDVTKLWFMYEDSFRNEPSRKDNLYGRGFSLYGLLKDDLNIDREDIEAKIRSRYFDFILFGSVRRCQRHLQTVLSHYSESSIVFIDGEDDQEILKPLIGRGVYFKRELNFESRYVRPIQFAIPEEKFLVSTMPKIKKMAHIDPRDRSTYIYDSEIAYYSDYRESYFGVTTKKAGWDCLRHYEIIANNCIPDFIDISQCPTMTMMKFPKLEIMLASRLVRGDQSDMDHDSWIERWQSLNHDIQIFARQRLTTIALGEYVLRTLEQIRRD